MVRDSSVLVRNALRLGISQLRDSVADIYRRVELCCASQRRDEEFDDHFYHRVGIERAVVLEPVGGGFIESTRAGAQHQSQGRPGDIESEQPTRPFDGLPT